MSDPLTRKVLADADLRMTCHTWTTEDGMMTDEELLDRITEMVRPPANTPDRDPIWRLIQEHRQVGWRRRFTANDPTQGTK